MKIYEILIPYTDNREQSTLPARQEFERYLLNTAGGYSQGQHVMGAWRNDNNTTFYSTMVPYRVSCKATELGKIVKELTRLFPDQHEMFVAEIGVVIEWAVP